MMIINRGTRKVLEEFKIGDLVEIRGEDSYFTGTLVAVFPKLNGTVRVVVENSDGILHIYAPKQLVKIRKESTHGKHEA
jgi:hypothetical protein